MLFDNPIFPITVSAGITLFILYLRELVMEPKKFKREQKLKMIKEQLSTYGNLLTLIEIAEKKADTPQISGKATHLFEMPHDFNGMRNIFNKYRYHLNNEIIIEFQNLFEKDTYFSLSRRNNQELSLSLGKMQIMIKKRYEDLLNDFEKLTGYKLFV